MKRIRNAVLATVVLLTISFLFLQHQEKFLNAYHFRRPHVHIEWGDEGATTKKPPERLNDDASSDNASQSNNPPGLGAEAPKIPIPLEPAEDASKSSPATAPFKVEFPFQNDLKLDLPVETFLQFANS